MKLERQLGQRLIILLLGVGSGLRLVFLSLQVPLGFQLRVTLASLLRIRVDSIRPLVLPIEGLLLAIGKVTSKNLSLLVLLELSQV